MRPKLPRFRVRTLLLAVALCAALLGAGVWYFTPRIGLRLDPEQTSWAIDEYPFGLVRLTNCAPRSHTLSFVSSSVIGLDLIVTDASSRVVSKGPYWSYDSPLRHYPLTHLVPPGAIYRFPVQFLRTAADWKPGTYTIEAVYDLGGVLVRSEKVTIQLLPRRASP